MKLFNDIGDKIKSFAKAWGWLLLICTIIAWLVLLIDRGADEWLPWIVLVSGIACIPSSWVLYGFGQLVDDVHSMRSQSAESAAQNDELPEL